MRQAAEYVPLPSSSERTLDAVENSKRDRHDGLCPSHINNRLIIWACICAICSSILSVIVVAGGVLFFPSRTSVQPLYGKALRRPNPYVNLDKVLPKANYTFPPIINFPPIVMQISTSDPQRKMREDDRQWHSRHGTVYQDDRHIVVSAETSTVVQFRNIDYAMERCILTVSMPQHTKPFNPGTLLLDSSVVEIWALDTTTEISRYIAGTWDHAPPRLERLATLTFSETGSSNLTEFVCRSNEFTTLELACSSSTHACMVDFW